MIPILEEVVGSESIALLLLSLSLLLLGYYRSLAMAAQLPSSIALNCSFFSPVETGSTQKHTIRQRSSKSFIVHTEKHAMELKEREGSRKMTTWFLTSPRIAGSKVETLPIFRVGGAAEGHRTRRRRLLCGKFVRIGEVEALAVFRVGEGWQAVGVAVE